MEAAHNGPAGESAAPGTVTLDVAVESPEEMKELGRRIAGVLAPGDLVMLTGELGAGEDHPDPRPRRGPRGARRGHLADLRDRPGPPPLGEGPALVHVDAYRLGGGLDEMEDLDLDVSLPESVIVVEWGDGKVEELSEHRLRVVIDRAVGDTDDERRTVTLMGIGARWAGLGAELTGA